MSFTELRSVRNNKESKSFVKSRQDDVPHGVDPATENKVADAVLTDGGHEPAAVVSSMAGLPQTIDVRASAVGGRGMHANVPSQPGDFGQRGILLRLTLLLQGQS